MGKRTLSGQLRKASWRKSWTLTSQGDRKTLDKIQDMVLYKKKKRKEKKREDEIKCISTQHFVSGTVQRN